MSGGSNMTTPKNAPERRRRVSCTDSFAALHEAVPSLRGAEASPTEIMKASASYIRDLTRQIQHLKRENERLEEQILATGVASSALGSGCLVGDDCKPGSAVGGDSS
ncbi:protein max-like [Haemaphysalis longicornis]